jgi:hypothetical protein
MPGRSSSSLGVGQLALSELEAARVRRVVGDFVERRRPAPHVRPKLDLGFRVSGQSVELFEVRPIWRGPSGEKRQHPFAKATYVRTRHRWRVFWLRQDLKWHGYEPTPEVSTIEEFVALVQEDRHACFFG